MTPFHQRDSTNLSSIKLLPLNIADSYRIVIVNNQIMSIPKLLQATTNILVLAIYFKSAGKAGLWLVKYRGSISKISNTFSVSSCGLFIQDRYYMCSSFVSCHHQPSCALLTLCQVQSGLKRLSPGLDTFQNPEGWFSYIVKAITSLNRSLASKKVMGRKRIRII